MSAALAACRVAADAGEFFAPVEPPAGSPGEDWTSLSDLVAAGRELERFVAAARRALAEGHGAASASVPLRTAASMWFLGLTARLVSPPLAAALLSGQVPRLTPATVWCRPTGPVAMAPPGLETGARPAPALSDGALDPVVVPLLSAVAGRFACFDPGAARQRGLGSGRRGGRTRRPVAAARGPGVPPDGGAALADDDGVRPGRSGNADPDRPAPPQLLPVLPGARRWDLRGLRVNPGYSGLRW